MIRRLLIASLALVGFGCEQESTPAGEFLICQAGGIASDGFCVYTQGIQETGFRCPSFAPKPYVRDGVDWREAAEIPELGSPFLCGPEGASSMRADSAWKAAGGEPPDLARVDALFASGLCPGPDDTLLMHLSGLDDGAPAVGRLDAEALSLELLIGGDEPAEVRVTGAATPQAPAEGRVVFLLDHSGMLIGADESGTVDANRAIDRSDTRIVLADAVLDALPADTDVTVARFADDVDVVAEGRRGDATVRDALWDLSLGESGGHNLGNALEVLAHTTGNNAVMLFTTRDTLSAEQIESVAAVGAQVTVVHLQPPVTSGLPQGRSSALAALACATGGSYHFAGTGARLDEPALRQHVRAALAGGWQVPLNVDGGGPGTLYDGSVTYRLGEARIRASLAADTQLSWPEAPAESRMCPADEAPSRGVTFVVQNTADAPRYLVERGDLCDPHTFADAEGPVARRVVNPCTAECACVAGTPESWATAYRVLAPGETYRFRWDAQRTERCEREVYCPEFEGRGHPPRFNVADPVQVNAANGTYTVALAFERALEVDPDTIGADGVVEHRGPADMTWFGRCAASALAEVEFQLEDGDVEVTIPLD